MSIDLPTESFRWPLFRLLTRAAWADADSSDPRVSGALWTVQPMKRRGFRQHGFYLKDLERATMPMVGRARLGFRLGQFDDAFVGGVTGADRSWDPDTNTLDTLPDLTNHVIRIQAAERPEDPAAAPAWTTVWLGYCDHVEDVGWGGSNVPAGERIFHCSDLIARAHRWQLDRHGHEVEGSEGVATFANARGHPGYNVGRGRDARAVGNKGLSAYSVNGASITFHTEPGAGDNWTDLEAVEHALAATRGATDPLFTLSGATDLLAGENPWEIRPGETALDFLERACRRERGKGCVQLAWTETGPASAVTVSLAISAQLYADKTYINPVDESVITLDGAQSDDTAVDVDLLGDHRQVVTSFQLTEPSQWTYDYLESQGEMIQVLVTLAYVDGYDEADGRGWALERRWSAGEQSDFEALTPIQRVEDRYRPVFQLHGLPRGWDCEAGDGNGDTRHRVDFRCADDGSITWPATSDPSDTSPLMIEVMDSLPLFEGYNYTGTPVRYDTETESGDPQRKGILILLRFSSDHFLFSEQTAKPAVPKVDHDGIWIAVPGDSGDGTRFISKSSVGSLAATYDLDDLAITVGLKLPHRVRLATYADGQTAATAQRRLTLTQPDAHLWLASSYAIWDLNTSTGAATTGHPPRYAAGGGGVSEPGILRDDRAALARNHALACAWYLEPRRTASWALRCFGLFPSFLDRTGAAIDYAQLGEVVHTLSANGQSVAVDTPVVLIRYNNETGVTSWETGWSSLDIE